MYSYSPDTNGGGSASTPAAVPTTPSASETSDASGEKEKERVSSAFKKVIFRKFFIFKRCMNTT